MGDIILIILLLAAATWALRSCLISRKGACSGRCGGCCGGSASCCHCKGCSPQHHRRCD